MLLNFNFVNFSDRLSEERDAIQVDIDEHSAVLRRENNVG